MRKAALLLLTLAILVSMTSCGSQTVTECPGGVCGGPPVLLTAPVSLSVTDTPPSGVTVLFFQVGITGATLTSSSGSTVSLYPGLLPQNAYPSIPINVTQLQTDSAFLASASVPAGTYTGMSLTFGPNSQLTIYNGSGAAIGSCANDSVCQLTPTASSLAVSFSSAPFPVTLSANTPLGLKLDIHLNAVIQEDLSVNFGTANGVTIEQLPSPPSGTSLPGVGGLTGTVQGLTPFSVIPNPDQITAELYLQTPDGRNVGVGLTNSTTYDFPSSVCSTANFVCLVPGEVVKVTPTLTSNGNLLASAITYESASGQTVVQGNVVQLHSSGGNTIMDLILQQGPPAPAAGTLPMGNRATVTVPSTGVAYAIDSDSFTLPGGLTFNSAANLMVGQQVSVVVVPGSVTSPTNPPSTTPIGSPAAITFTASSITLEPTQLTGTVNSAFPINVSGMNFVIATYPNYFVPPAATAAAAPTLATINLTVQTTSATTFTDLNPDSISGLAAGDVVSIKGWLFPYGAVPQYCIGSGGCAPLGEFAAETVVNRPGPTPLF